eukprot:9005393-Pyramimonas_sp.AAC.1
MCSSTTCRGQQRSGSAISLLPFGAPRRASQAMRVGWNSARGEDQSSQACWPWQLRREGGQRHARPR